VLQVRITLEELRPVIWRRLLVPGNVTLGRLHDIFQAAMGWTDSHLHQFRIAGVLYGMHVGERPGNQLDEQTYTAIGAVGSVRRFFYDYDFGDNWNHEVVLEGVTLWPWGLKYAVCLDGQRSCPPEDVGGPSGYEELLRVLADPEHDDYEHLKAWSGGGFDPEEFSVTGANITLQRLPVRG
jgi:hypothetical protein